MAYVIREPFLVAKDRACVEEYLVEAIYYGDDLPADQLGHLADNAAALGPPQAQS